MSLIIASIESLPVNLQYVNRLQENKQYGDGRDEAR
jgi:hypothetical protein